MVPGRGLLVALETMALREMFLESQVVRVHMTGSRPVLLMASQFDGVCAP
jgi:hypothetical protein